MVKTINKIVKEVLAENRASKNVSQAKKFVMSYGGRDYEQATEIAQSVIAQFSPAIRTNDMYFFEWVL